jgi:peptide/nickel transport system substrate-binding protein
VEFRVLGSVEAADGDRPVVWGAGKPAELLGILLTRANQAVSAASLIDDLWDYGPPKTASKTLQTYISQLRRLLGDTVIVSAPKAYRLAVDARALDAARFGEQLESGRSALQRGDPQAAAQSLRGALSLWRGAAFEQFEARPWALVPAGRLEKARLEAQELRIEADIALGSHRGVISELEALVGAHPYREHLTALLMVALYRSGRQAEALELCRLARRRMLEQLGIDAATELAELERRILVQDPQLAAPAAERAGVTPASADQQRGSGRATPGPVRRLASMRWTSVAAASVALAAVAAIALTSGGPGSRGSGQGNSITLVSTNGRLVSGYQVGAFPAHTLRGFGYLWTSNEADGTVSRIDPNGRNTETIPVGPSPQGMAVADGEIWVANGGNGTVSAIDPRQGKVVLTLRVGNGPVAVAAVRGQLLVANAIDGTVSVISPGAGAAVTTVLVGPQPTAIVANGNDAWVALAGSGSVAEIDSGSRSVIGSVNVGGDPVALAAGDGQLWVANAADDTVSRVNASSGTVDATIPVGGAPTSVAVGSGILWVTLADGKLVKINARSPRLTSSYPVTGEPVSVAADGRSAWVASVPLASAHRGGTLRVAAGSQAFCCVDPAGAIPPFEAPVLDVVYDGLLAYRASGGPAGDLLVGDLARIVPAAADGGRTYVFRLRRGVRFSNGQPVRASDVRASFVRMLRNSASSVLPLYLRIVGAATCGSGGPCDLSGGIVADDRADTVTFHLTSPDPDFLYGLALPNAFVVPASAPTGLAARPLPGTGPYQITAFSPHKIILTRNPRFRVFAPLATPAGFPDRIVITAGATVSTELSAVERGAADVVTAIKLPAATATELAVRYATRFHADSAGATYYFYLNTRLRPFTSLDARLAVNDGVDRERLVELSGGPYAAWPTCQILPPDFPGYVPHCPFGQRPSVTSPAGGPDLATARRLVESSGTEGDRVQVRAPQSQAAAAQYLVSVLARIGYRAAATIIPDQAYYPSLGDPKIGAQAGWSSWAQDYTSAADFIQPLFGCPPSGVLPPVTFNNSKFCSLAVERQISLASILQTRDPVSGQQAWAEADRMIVNSAAAVPYANLLAVTLLSERTGNYEYSPEWGVLLDQLWVR